MSYKGYTDDDLVDILYVVDQSMPHLDPHDKAYINTLLESYESYGKAVLSDKQRDFILHMKEQYLTS